MSSPVKVSFDELSGIQKVYFKITNLSVEKGKDGIKVDDVETEKGAFSVAVDLSKVNAPSDLCEFELKPMSNNEVATQIYRLSLKLRKEKTGSGYEYFGVCIVNYEGIKRFFLRSNIIKSKPRRLKLLYSQERIEVLVE